MFVLLWTLRGHNGITVRSTIIPLSLLSYGVIPHFLH